MKMGVMKLVLQKARFVLVALVAACTLGASVPAISDDAVVMAGSMASLDEQTQSLKKAVLDLNRELFVLEEELLYPANTQVAVFVSMDVGEYFGLDSIELTLDGKDVSSYLYTEREVDALHRGGVHQLYRGNLKVGEHELVAVFTGAGPHDRDYRRGATLSFDKAIGAKFVELRISDKAAKLQPEFVVREWD
ncbi:MAG: AraC family transcriptional regulator [Gammaproteobacteria bacterium]|nr:AraC family transcriptional regulator [Gammaproteobacteria bacterium]NND54023.1 AraC family transcriptional regulator [Gammaproteobacteria bacterium]